MLLDKPGLSLHGQAQAGRLKYFDAELSKHQLFYTRHSPFIFDPTKFVRDRIIQGLGIDLTQTLPKVENGAKVLANLFDATDASLSRFRRRQATKSNRPCSLGRTRSL